MSYNISPYNKRTDKIELFVRLFNERIDRNFLQTFVNESLIK